MDRDERDLVRRCLAGDQTACTALVDAYAQMVGTLIWRATGDAAVVEDLVQETFLRVFRALASFEARAKLSTWIGTIPHRIAIDHIRQKRFKEQSRTTRDDLDVAALDSLPAAGLDPEAAASQVELDRLVQECLLQLPERYRLAVAYAAIDGLDYSAISLILGVPVGTVKTLVFRGKQMLKERIAATLNARVRPREAPDAL